MRCDSPGCVRSPPAARRAVDLRGKRILLTGASSGIGAVAAEKLAAEGATVIVVARRADLLAEVVATDQAQGGEAIAMPANLADLDAVDALVQAVGRVDILINNAGRSIRRPLIESLERWHDVERTMAINYYAPLRLIRGLVPGMIERGDGHVINVSSWRVMPESSPLFAVYNASKAALSAVSRVIDTELAESGVHSTTIYYPLVATPMIAPTRAYDGLPALSRRRGRRLDGHRGPHPADPDRAPQDADACGRSTSSRRAAQRRDEALDSAVRAASARGAVQQPGRSPSPRTWLVGAVLTTAAFFCVALVGALAKVSGQYTSTGVLLLFQNVICLLFIDPGGAARRMGIAADRARSACTSCARRPGPPAGTRCSSRSRRYRWPTRRC